MYLCLSAVLQGCWPVAGCCAQGGWGQYFFKLLQQIHFSSSLGALKSCCPLFYQAAQIQPESTCCIRSRLVCCQLLVVQRREYRPPSFKDFIRSVWLAKLLWPTLNPLQWPSKTKCVRSSHCEWLKIESLHHLSRLRTCLWHLAFLSWEALTHWEVSLALTCVYLRLLTAGPSAGGLRLMTELKLQAPLPRADITLSF